MVKNRICAKRVKKGLSQRDLAQVAGLSRSVLSLIESGRYFCERDDFMKLAAALESAPEELYSADVLRTMYGIGAPEKPERPLQRSVTIRIPQPLAARLDIMCRAEGIASRDEAARYLIRRGLDEQDGKVRS